MRIQPIRDSLPLTRDVSPCLLTTARDGELDMTPDTVTKHCNKWSWFIIYYIILITARTNIGLFIARSRMVIISDCTHNTRQVWWVDACLLSACLLSACLFSPSIHFQQMLSTRMLDVVFNQFQHKIHNCDLAFWTSLISLAEFGACENIGRNVHVNCDHKISKWKTIYHKHSLVYTTIKWCQILVCQHLCPISHYCHNWHD